MATIAQPLDFLGINYYRRRVVAGAIPRAARRQFVQPGRLEYTDMGWEVSPDALDDLLLRLHASTTRRRSTSPRTAPRSPTPRHDGHVDDPRRTAYIEAHLGAVARAIDAGVPVAGYFVWSLLDNFEWATATRSASASSTSTSRRSSASRRRATAGTATSSRASGTDTLRSAGGPRMGTVAPSHLTAARREREEQWHCS